MSAEVIDVFQSTPPRGGRPTEIEGGPRGARVSCRAQSGGVAVSVKKKLKKALNAHAEVVGGSAVSLKKAQRANAKVAAAASAYAEVVYSKAGISNPFSEMLEPGLEHTTIASLAAERDAIALNLTGPIPKVG